MRALALALGLALAGPAAAQAVLEAPSGQVVTLYDVVLEAEAGRARFLFHAPEIALDAAEGRDFAQIEADFPWLCERVILPALAQNGWEAGQVVIALADREIPFGERDPEAVQFIEAFAIEDGACVLEVF